MKHPDEPDRRRLQKLSIVLSVYNEEVMLPHVWAALKRIKRDYPFRTEILFVNDGSTDRSGSVLEEIRKKEGGSHDVKIIHFTRNFGHEAAMTAGIDACSGDAVICMDADLQHPPGKIREMAEAFTSGFDVVIMNRLSSRGQSFLKTLTSRIFHFILRRIEPFPQQGNPSDFFLISAGAAEVLRRGFRERLRFTRGLIQSLGFRKTVLDYNAPARTGGRTKYTYWKQLKMAAVVLVSYTKKPLFLAIILSGLFAVFSVILGITSTAVFFLRRDTPPGYTTLIVFMSLGFSMIFLILGIMGIYLGIWAEENRNRPMYIVQKKSGFREKP
ncbi:glycosyltransferase family 2 protein [bacterium]|nr:glycosyltransferase family 2 protein [bacterium]